jgi:hypothetical protein
MSRPWDFRSRAPRAARTDRKLFDSLISFAIPVASRVCEVIVNTSAPAGIRASTFARASAVVAARCTSMPLAARAFAVRSTASSTAVTLHVFIGSSIDAGASIPS